MIPLVLSLFPGIDLLGRAFESEGFCVVRGPDLLWGGDVRGFHVPPGRFDGIVAGSPCQDFSRARRSAPTGYGLEMLAEFRRVVLECQPAWFLLENVAAVPDVQIPGYAVQRFGLNSRECGMLQVRLRYFQFGSNSGAVLVPDRLPFSGPGVPTCMASEGDRPGRRGWSEFCMLQGLPGDFDLPGLSVTAKYRAVGNGVPIPMGRTVARAIKKPARLEPGQALCVCGCGRIVPAGQLQATAACRKRMQRRRDRDRSIAGVPGKVTQ
jgi:DNA (cytosine-5)-methyltransferase 1